MAPRDHAAVPTAVAPAFVLALALALALAALTRPRPARADPPPVARCAPAGGGWSLAASLPGRVVAMESARDGERVVVALSVQAGRRRRVFVGEVGGDGQWAVAPREVSGLRPGPGSVMALGVSGGRRHVVLAARGRVQSVVLGDDAAGDRAVELEAPVPRARAVLLSADAGGFVLAWPRPGRVAVQRMAVGDERAGAAVEARLPAGTMAVSAAPGADGAVGLIVRSPGRRYFVAVLGADGRVHWPGNGPAGCDEHGRCPAVRLWSAPGGGFVAGWAARPTDDGLAVFGARAVDAEGHSRGRAVAFIPVVRGAIVAGPQGQGMMLQLGRPMVLRGGARPVAVPQGEDATQAQAPERGHGARSRRRESEAVFPIAARAWRAEDLGPGLEIVGVTGAGTVTRGLLRCGEPGP